MNQTNILTGIHSWISTGKLQTRQRLCGGSGSPAKRFGQGEKPNTDFNNAIRNRNILKSRFQMVLVLNIQSYSNSDNIAIAFRYPLKSRPFPNHPLVNHSKSVHFRLSDPHCNGLNNRAFGYQTIIHHFTTEVVRYLVPDCI